MVTKNVKVIESDLSGEPGAETTLIGLKGDVMELDLTPDERAELDAILEPYIARGRKLGPMTVKTFAPRKVPVTTAEERAGIRTWAIAQGYEVASHGQIPNDVVNAYRAAHPRGMRVNPRRPEQRLSLRTPFGPGHRLCRSAVTA